uniref:Protein kinase domain-containing protein n=1 Tax=viral metagenome TaxID=1070528 RepID=A0A6C0LTR3_9ZZZZ
MVSRNELLEYAKQLNITGISKMSKSQLLKEIGDEKASRYVRIRQLGDKGRDAITYLVSYEDKQYAMKTFKPRKSSSKISDEINLQTRMSKVSPVIFDFDLDRKYIVMDKLDRHLVDITSRVLSISLNHQKQLINIYKEMDSQGVFHGDANPLNYMIKGRKLYVIDFGMSKTITPQLIKKLGTSTPNIDIMTLGMVLKLRSIGYTKQSYSYLVNYIDPRVCEQLGL